MKIIYQPEAGWNFYPYKVEVPFDNRSPLYEVGEWVKSTELDCIIGSGNSFFRTEQDAMLFILKWSQ
jgi:hypothetical protein